MHDAWLHCAGRGEVFPKTGADMRGVIGSCGLLVAFLAISGPADAFDFKSFVEERMKSVGQGIDRALEGITGQDKQEPTSVPDQGQPHQEGVATTPAGGMHAPSVATPSPAPATPSREQVAEIQTRLNDLGYDAGPVDGLFGQRTARAIMQFQRDRGLLMDGKATSALVSELRIASADPQPAQEPQIAAPSAASGPSHSPTPAAPAAARFDDLTYANLLRLYIAEHHDLLDNDAFAWLYFRLFKGPQEASPACAELQQQVRNPINFADLVRRERAELPPVLAEFAPRPTVGEFTVDGYMSFGDYDLSHDRFPIRHIGFPGMDPGFSSACKISGDPGGASHAPLRFRLQPEGLDALESLPMEKEQARALLERRYGLHLQLPTRAEIRVGPLPYLGGRTADGIAARVLSLAVLDPETKAVLYRFPAELFEDGPASVADAGDVANQPEALPLTPYRVTLFMLRDNPAVLTDQIITELTRQQILAEQRFWQMIEQNLGHVANPQSPHPGINIARPLFAYEWQSLAASQPALADEVLEVFTRRDAPWEFYTREPAYDSRLKAFVEASLFSRDAISGREAVFLAPQLAPTFAQHLEKAAAAVPARAGLSFALAAKYDPATGQLHFGESYTVRGDGQPVRPLDAVQRPLFAADGTVVTSLISSPLPPSAEGSILYAVPHGIQDNPDRDPSMRTSRDTPASHWREMLRANTNGGLNLGSISALALDRKVEFPPIAIDQQTVESAQRGHASPHGIFQVTGRVTLEVGRAELVTITKDDRHRRGGALFAKVVAMDILGPEGQLLARLGLEDLETPDSLAAAEESAAQAATSALRDKAARLAQADIVGIRLGMPFDEAERIVRERMAPGAVLDYANPPSPPRVLQDYRTFHSADGNEQITLFRAIDDRNRVVAIARAVALPESLDRDTLKARLAEKYGEADRESKATQLWTASEDASRCGVSFSWDRSGLRTIEGPDEVMKPYVPILSTSEPQFGKDPTRDLWQGCGPSVSANILSSRLQISMYDLGAYRPGFLAAWGVSEDEESVEASTDLDL